MIPPRFDTFSEQLLGTWSKCHPYEIPQSNEGSDDDGMVVGCVEEVMRSCGGAGEQSYRFKRK